MKKRLQKRERMKNSIAIDVVTHCLVLLNLILLSFLSLCHAMGDGIFLSSFLCSVLFCVTFFKFSRNITPQEGCKEGAGAWYPHRYLALPLFTNEKNHYI